MLTSDLIILIMSARNFLSAREKNNYNKIIDCLPSINKQKLTCRPGHDLPALSANTGHLYNRNLTYSFVDQYDNFERCGTPFSDFFSESETGTPDILSEESDSSTGSVLRRNTAQATNVLGNEWDIIERTLYDEDGEKSTRPQIIEECKQWRQLHPHLRVIGKAIPLPEKKLSYRQNEKEETIAMHYTDYEEYSEGDERHSESSADVTPQNSPRASSVEDFYEPKLSREKLSLLPIYDQGSQLNDTFCSLLQITPIQVHNPILKRKASSIMKSEIASSNWMRSSRPDSSVNINNRNSAKSFISLDVKGYGNLALSASERNKILKGRVVTAKHRDMTRLQPLYSPEMNFGDPPKLINVSHNCNIRKVSLPPLLLEEERGKLTTANSARKNNIRSNKKGVIKSLFHR